MSYILRNIHHHICALFTIVMHFHFYVAVTEMVKWFDDFTILCVSNAVTLPVRNQM